MAAHLGLRLMLLQISGRCRFRGFSFDLVVFDPPHLIRAGDKSWLKKEVWPSSVPTGRRIFRRGLRNVSVF